MASLKKIKSNWRAACLYRSPGHGGETFALFRKSRRVYRHAVTIEGVDPTELDFYRTTRWDKLRTLQLSNGEVYIAFVDRNSSTLAIRKVEDDGTLGDTFETDIGRRIDDVALLEYEGGLFLFLVGDGGKPEFYLFRPNDSRTFRKEKIGTVDDRPDLFKSWHAVVSLEQGSVGLYDFDQGVMGILTAEQILSRSTVPLYEIRDRWSTFTSYVNGNREPMVIFARNGWRWK